MKTKEIIQYIVIWLENYIKKTCLKGFIVGISGGIDSAVTSMLVAKTRYPVLLLQIPIYQESNQIKRMHDHTYFLKNIFSNIESKTIDLSPLYDRFCSIVKAQEEPSSELELTLANTRSRLRMTLLYYYAGIYRYLVSGTGNKIEDFGVGFFTKYGDGGVDISPIADLTKTQVQTLATELGIIKSIQDALPTDGLWEDNRSDEEQLGFSYKELEWAMRTTKEGKNKEQLDEKQKELLEKYERLHQAARHKIDPIPVCKIPKELL